MTGLGDCRAARHHAASQREVVRRNRGKHGRTAGGDLFGGESMRIVRQMLVLLALLAAAPAHARAEPLDPTARTAIITAFAPEWAALLPMVEDQRRVDVNGVAIVTGRIAGKKVVLMESGVSMVNAAMNTQLLIDRFRVKRILFSGIAGGADPALNIGDVSVPERWAQNFEVVMARETPGGRVLPPHAFASGLPPFGMMYPRGVRIGTVRYPDFPADPALLATARTIAPGIALARCTGTATRGTMADESAVCLVHGPKIVVGGTGVSSPAFVDNAAYREYLHASYGARVIDMESAAVAQTAFANAIPFIAFRSLSDLAGGDAGENAMRVFMALAADNSAAVVKAFVAALPD